MKTKNNIMRNIIGILLVSSSFIHSQNLDPYQFFPTNIGDRWEYTWAGPDVVYTVIRDSIDVKDSSRFVFFYAPPLYYGADYRIDKNYNIFYLPQFDNLHEYKLDAQVGGKWVVFVSDSNKWEESRVSGIYQSFVFGKLTTIKEIQHYQCRRRPDSLIDTTLIDVQKLAYGFGLISKENYVLQPYLLRGCRINKVTYGTVDVKELPNDLPSDFILYQNYPNPFNPSTTISFSIPRYSHVTIKVFDLLGREIQDLANDYFNPGTYKVEFNERNLSSGIYFYQLIADKTVRTMKMILQK
ncbi:MAG: T9SS type A sorting domain-containing protein [Bacteroidetes bacterium]|nr:T9SS type A sorting domain-containing protein [Bacteroidota bacterium]